MSDASSDEVSSSDSSTAEVGAIRSEVELRPRSFHLDADEQRVVREALGRGAFGDAIVEVLMLRRFPSAPRTPSGRVTDSVMMEDYQSPLRAPRSTGNEERQRLRLAIGPEIGIYLQRVDDEFDHLPPIVQKGFDPLEGDTAGSAREKYREIRPLYYRGGWRCPKQQIFDHIVAPSAGARMLNYPIVGGIHEKMLEILLQLTATMDATRKGLSERVGQQVFTVGGFVPRVQAGSTELSNHAFGLAVDIDPDWNPQFKSSEVVKALHRATEMDFSRSLVPARSDQRIEEISKTVELASSRLKQWLARVLPEYKTTVDGLRALQHKLDHAKTRAEREQAKAALLSAKNAFKNNVDLQSLDVLLKAYGEKTVLTWASYGIQTVPAELIKAFKTLGSKYGAKWGGEFKSTKDIMHLELLAPLVIQRNGPCVGGVEDLATGPLPPSPICGK